MEQAFPQRTADLDRSLLLATLPDAERQLLLPHLSLVSLTRDQALFDPGQVVGSVHFPCDSTLVSLQVVMREGQAAETGLIGCEGAVGGVVSRGHEPAFARALVQVPGEAWRIDVDALDEARGRSAKLTETLARYADFRLAQGLQAVACTKHHSVEQRIACILLAVQDRHGDVELPFTQEQLSSLLGVGRTYVSKTANALQARGMISYTRGQVRVLDRLGLKQVACACQLSVWNHYERVVIQTPPAAA